MFQAQEEKLKRAPIWVILPWTAMLALNCLWVHCTAAQQRSPEQLAQQKLSAIPNSGALVGLTSGQTLWIAPVDDRIQILAAPDYIVPRKDGFWHVRFDVKWAPQEGSPAEAVAEAVKNDPALSGVPPGYGRLWAVPLKKGMDAAPWLAEQPITTAQGDENREENQMEEGQAEEEEGHQQQLLFLGPDYLSFFESDTVFNRGIEYGSKDTNAILKITSPRAPVLSGTEQLLVQEVPAPISDSAREKGLAACIDPKGNDELREEGFLRNAESTIGIKRENQKWVYNWGLGYSSGPSHGYYTRCPVSALPPKSIVGSDELFPDWKKIKSMFPGAEDAFSSPSHDLVLVFAFSHLIIASVQDGNVGKPLADIRVFVDRPVMVQWAIGKYVDAWSKELAPYFHAYASETQGDAKQANKEGLIFMQRHQPMSAVGWFVGAAMDDSSNAEYANNAGFAYYQMGKYEESAVWLEKAISIDSKRAVAYLNLGDAYAKLKRNAKARRAYTKYLELAPDSAAAPLVRKKLNSLSPSS